MQISASMTWTDPCSILNHQINILTIFVKQNCVNAIFSFRKTNDTFERMHTANAHSERSCSNSCTFDAMNYTASAAQLSMSTSIHFTARMNK